MPDVITGAEEKQMIDNADVERRQDYAIHCWCCNQGAVG